MGIVTLEDHLLDHMSRVVKEDMKFLTSNIEIDLLETFGSADQTREAGYNVKKAVSIYGGIHHTFGIVFDEEDLVDNEEEFLRAYTTYVSSKGTADTLRNGGETELSLSEEVHHRFNIEFDRSDKKTLVDVVKDMSSYLGKASSLTNVKGILADYFNSLSEHVAVTLNMEKYSELKKKYDSLEVKSKNFTVKGIEEVRVPEPRKRSSSFSRTSNRNKNKSVSDKTSPHTKGLQTFEFQPVQKEEIVANRKGKDLVSNIIPCLFHYDSSRKDNLFKGFSQYLLFAGKRGTGKTMLARYAMTLAEDMSSELEQEVNIVNLEFEDRWQYGPLENIRTQLREISRGDGIYIAFVDEIDTKIPKRDGNGKAYRNDVIGEFLRFRGGGDYVNKGNYVILATSNKPKDLDDALLNVFNTVEVEGPKTADQKVTVLKNNLSEGIAQGYAGIRNWDRIGRLMEKYDLTGRDIYNVAEESKMKFRRIASEIPFSLGFDEKKEYVQRILAGSNGTYKTTDKDILQSIKSQVIKEEISGTSYLRGD